MYDSASSFRLLPSLPLCYCLDWIYRSLAVLVGPRGSTSGDPQQYGYYNYGVSLVTSGSVQGPHLAHPQPVSSHRGKKYVYSLRVINPKRKSLFEMKKFTSESRFQFPGELRSCIKVEFSTVVPGSDNFSLGYYHKGRGNSKIFLINENDMDTMYSQYAEAQEIQLWCDGRCADKYTPAQLRLWVSNMLQIGTHKDYSMPPDVPMFGGGKKRYEKRLEVVDALSGIAEGIVRALNHIPELSHLHMHQLALNLPVLHVWVYLQANRYN